ncbi:MAG: cytidylate kinase-like family protein [Proteobacteria bacterium]|nr:cytidylate kinase-like family protein [Pseudomonadota bacterium]
MLITISRQYAAGSSAVAQRVADALGWTLLDDELVHQVAQRSGLSPEEVAELDERIPTFMERVAQTNALAYPDMMMPSAEIAVEPEQSKLARITRDLIEELGRRDRLVLVGRAAAAVLARQEGVVRVRLVASREFRIRNAIERLGVPPEEAPGVLEDKDKNRERYHREYYGRDWSDPLLYHMVLNTEVLGMEGAADLVVAHARGRGW